MTIHEPATFATDLALAAWNAWLALRLRRVARDTGRRVAASWAGAFACASAAALAGGLHHGLGPKWPAPVSDGLWIFTLVALCATGFCLLAASAHATLTGRAQCAARLASLAACATIAAVAVRAGDFVYAVGGYGLGLAAVFAVARRQVRRPHARWLLAGVGASLVAAVVQQAQLAPAPWFNHNDLFHVIQGCAVWLLHRGARDQPDAGEV